MDYVYMQSDIRFLHNEKDAETSLVAAAALQSSPFTPLSFIRSINKIGFLIKWSLKLDAYTVFDPLSSDGPPWNFALDNAHPPWELEM